jgi:hydrogenase-4 component F
MIVAIPLIPLLPALVCALPKGSRLVPAVTLAGAVIAFVLSVAVLYRTRGGEFVVVVRHWLEVDTLSALLMALVALVYFTSALFSWGYIGHETANDRRMRAYYANFNLFAFSMLAIPLLSELGLVWIFVELTTLLSILLVSYDHSVEAIEASWKYMILTLLGATTAVLGVLVLFWALHGTGSMNFTWSGLNAAKTRMPEELLAASFALLFVGYGAKIGLVPLHAWLPDAHSQAPSPVCAMLSGIETSVVLYVILRLRPVFAADSGTHVGLWFALAGLLSVIVAALLIVQTHDYKRLFAFSTVEHMGIVLVAASLMTPIGDVAALWQMIAHAVTKSFCFYAAGVTLVTTGTRSIAGVRGLFGSNRLAAGGLLLGALAIGGAPPFAVFLSELAILRAAVLANALIVVALLVIFLSLAFFGLLAHATHMLSGEPLDVKAGNVPATCAIATVLAVIPVVVLGLWLPLGLADALRHAARALGA